MLSPQHCIKMARNVPGVDGSTIRKLKRGQVVIDARLDLHGMGRMDAREALMAAIQEAYARGARCVLVITGKGLILREQLPQWLADPLIAPRVLTMQEAAPEHGGGGAFYVLVRRKRGVSA